LRTKVLWAVFAGGTIGTFARYLVLLAITQSGVSAAWLDLLVTTVVNLAGAFALGVIQSASSKKSDAWNGFWATGFAGGFTTMSGLALITAGSELGLAANGYLYWLAVIAQVLVGVLVYWFGKKLARSR
jgi:CrcB protein